MKIAYFDCFSGIAGDMALAALLDCGAPLDQLKADLASLNVEGWDIRADDVLRSGIHGVKVTITENNISDADELAVAHAHHHAHDGDHHHSHDEHEHHHSHDGHEHHHHHHDEAHSHSHSHEHHHGRSMSEIREIIERSALNLNVKSKAIAIFGEVARAEAKIHHSTPDEVHFHEIGGLDSLLDIVGVAWCLDYLGIEAVYASALPMSSGTVKCAHGLMPIPAPATLEILRGAPWTPTEIVGELVTPTGAGILAALCESYGPAPAMQMETIGLGAGTKEMWGTRPNLLRVFVGEASEPAKSDGLQWTTLALLETNIDDMNPQLWESVFDALFQAGALDVWTTPIAMKKGRPAHTLSVLGSKEAYRALLGAILRHTTTIGVRVSSVERAALPRSIASVTTKWGEVRVKIAAWNEGDVRRAHPEWEDVKARAEQNNVSAREVYEAALAAAQTL